MGANSSSNARRVMAKCPARICCKPKQPPPPEDARSLSINRPQPELESLEERESTKSLPATVKTSKSLQTSLISWYKNLNQIRQYPAMTRPDALACYETWQEAKERRGFDDNFVDEFAKHFKEKDFEESSARARRLFAILEVAFKNLKMFDDSNMANRNANALEGKSDKHRLPSNPNLLKTIKSAGTGSVRTKQRDSRTKQRDSKTKQRDSKNVKNKNKKKKEKEEAEAEAELTKSLNDSMDGFGNDQAASSTGWERLMIRVGKALKRQSISPQFYLDVYEILFFTIGAANVVSALGVKESWRRMERSAMDFIRVGLLSETTASDLSATSEQIDRVLVGFSRNQDRGDGLANASVEDNEDENANNSYFNNNSSYRGPRVIFGEKGFIYL